MSVEQGTTSGSEEVKQTGQEARDVLAESQDLVRAVWRWLRWVLGLMRYIAARFIRDRCQQIAASLTYTSLLALVPLTTICATIFAAFPTFGPTRDDISGVLTQALAPEVRDAVIENMAVFTKNAGGLTAVGTIGLLVSAILLFFTIETAFNAIWRVKRGRPLVSRVLTFWGVISFSPILLSASLLLSRAIGERVDQLGLASQELGWAAELIARATTLLPFFIQGLAFTVIYLLVPNRPIRWRDALLGGVVGAALMEGAKATFGSFLINPETYAGIYGRMAVVPIFLIWLYIVWVTILVGAVITAALPEWRSGYGRGKLAARNRRNQMLPAALALLDVVARSERHGVLLSRGQLEKTVGLAGPLVDDVLEALTDAGWLAETVQHRFVTSRAQDEVTLFELTQILGLRSPPKTAKFIRNASWTGEYARIVDDAEASDEKVMSISIKDLLASQP
ncbi:MAG: YihY family inner membrane protein [Alphaproteobacteria bacterium]